MKDVSKALAGVDVLDAEDGVVEEGEVLVVLRPGSRDIMDQKEGWVFVLPPGEQGEQFLRDRLGRKRGLSGRPGAVKFRLERRSMPAVMALMRLDMFYRSEQRNGREEIMALWAKEVDPESTKDNVESNVTS